MNLKLPHCAPPPTIFLPEFMNEPTVPFVRIKLVGATFAEVDIKEGDTVSKLVERACVKFSHWGVNAGQVSLFLVAQGDDLPPPSAEERACLVDQIGWSPVRAGITSGSWLVVRKNVTSACCPRSVVL